MKGLVILVLAAAVFVQWHNELFAPKFKQPGAGAAVLVTGASSGIGRAAALHLAQKGFSVYAGVRKQADADALADVHNLTPVILDVTKQEDIERVAQQLGDDLFALVNNAGMGLRFPFEYTSKQKRDTMLAINLVGVWDLTAALLPAIKRNQGRVINIGSLSGERSTSTMSVYAGTKFGLRGWSEGLRRQLKPLGVHVSIVEPGFIRTPMISDPETRGNPKLEAKAKEYGPFFTTAYGEKIAGLIERLSESTDVTNAAIDHAMTAQRPQSRYLLTKTRFMAYLFWYIPDWAADLIQEFFERPPQ